MARSTAGKKTAAPRRRRAAPTTPPQRRQRMLDAAVAEFARGGYLAASTNAMAREAGVAKGLLFHHFGSKDDLLRAAFDHVVERTAAAMMDGLEDLPKDLFERLWVLGMRKLRLFQQDPVAFGFLAVALGETPEALRRELLAKQAARSGPQWAAVLDGLDTSRLRPGVALQDAVETISLLMEGLERVTTPMLAAQKDRGAAVLEEVSQRVRTHLLRLRDGLYVPGEERAS